MKATIGYLFRRTYELSRYRPGSRKQSDLPGEDRPVPRGEHEAPITSHDEQAVPVDKQASAASFRTFLSQLEVERIEAKEAGLADWPDLMGELEDEIALCRAMYVLTAVTEIAVLRAELSGRFVG